MDRPDLAFFLKVCEAFDIMIESYERQAAAAAGKGRMAQYTHCVTESTCMIRAKWVIEKAWQEAQLAASRDEQELIAAAEKEADMIARHWGEPMEESVI